MNLRTDEDGYLEPDLPPISGGQGYMQWWNVAEALIALAFEILHRGHTHNFHGSYSSALVITDDATGQKVDELPGPHLTF